MFKAGLKTIFIRFTIFVTLVIIGAFSVFAYAIFEFDHLVAEKLDSKKILHPTEFYAAPMTFTAHMQVPADRIEKILLKQQYRKRQPQQRLFSGDFFIGSPQDCQSLNQIVPTENELTCIAFVNKSVLPNKSDTEVQFIYIDIPGVITRTYQGTNLSQSLEVTLEAPLVAQFRGNEPTIQKEVSLSEIPPLCLQAVMAIEDDKFLEHKGVSYSGIFRAVIKNALTGRRAQGGSTITQQLVKNYFLSNERSYKRKVQEIFMAIVLESKFSKDQIFETYLNVIYMGQNGTFRIHGYAAAANYYFGRDLNDLKLSECALLAAILNGPALYNPFKNIEPTTKRRNLVLDRMGDLNYISKDEAEKAKSEPLPKETLALASETAPYYLDAVRKQMSSLKIPIDGTKIYTGLQLEEQQIAQESLRKHLEYLEKNNKFIKEMKEKKHSLEGVVLSGDPKTGLVSVAVGGRNFRMTQFNRAVDGHRQVGSIMKPFVYLTALLNNSPDGKPYLPWSKIKDEKFTSKYQGQTWSPDNYGKKYYGDVPLFYGLKNSLNAATASLGLAVGIENIATVAHILGIESKLKPLPSLTLGSFELYPKEVLQAYMAVSQMGKKSPLSFIRKVVNESGSEVFVHNPTPQPTVDPKAVAGLVSMMKQTILSGTARSVFLNGFTHPAGGKTGTTSDNKDAWFIGFTPYKTTLVWVGYDNNTTHKLTGVSGAVPIWTDFMKKTASIFPPDDFAWPEDTEKIALTEEQLRNLNALQSDEDSRSVELIVPKGITFDTN